MERTLVLHFHELWLKGGNRNFFLGKLLMGVRQSLQPLPARARIVHSRLLVDLPEEAVPAAVERLKRVFGVVYFAVARRVAAEREALFEAAQNGMALAGGSRLCPSQVVTPSATSCLAGTQIGSPARVLVLNASPVFGGLDVYLTARVILSWVGRSRER